MLHLDRNAKLAAALGHEFNTPDLLQRALTHCSASGINNERLEFLGDGLLNFVIAEAAYRAWPRASEGDLSRWRASLVCEDRLAGLARDLKLSDFLKMGTGELKSGGYRRESILADTLEALFGAVYEDAGFEVARAVVLKHYAPLLATPPQAAALKDSKTRLQELLQAKGLALPEYRVLKEDGPAHRRNFQVSCQLADHPHQTVAEGPSRKQAEQDAARAMLDHLKEHPHA
jgi:ribonuclease-3